MKLAFMAGGSTHNESDKKYLVVLILTIICIVFALATQVNDGMYDLFSFHSMPTYFWQYFSGTFMLGSKGAPSWFLWVHLFLNLLMIIPFGILLEKNVGSKITFSTFLISMIVCSVSFQILLYGKDEVATGISAVGYAFVAGGVIQLYKSWKIYSFKVKAFFIVLCVLAMIMLLPMITGWISTCLHISGIISYFVVYGIDRLIHLK